MARPSKAARKLRKKIEKKQLKRQLKKSKRKAKRRKRREKLRSKVAPARIEAKATKHELGELKQTLGDATPTDSISRTLKGSVKLTKSGAETVGSAVDNQIERTEPGEYGVDFNGDGAVDGLGAPTDDEGLDLTFGGEGGSGPVDGLGGSSQRDEDDEIRFL